MTESDETDGGRLLLANQSRQGKVVGINQAILAHVLAIAMPISLIATVSTTDHSVFVWVKAGVSLPWALLMWQLKAGLCGGRQATCWIAGGE